jgi:hypothetical protein
MAVQQEIKSQLAKLLATEDIIVEHKDVETAQFNVHTRELLLPMWDRASEDVYDMLVGHEVGHALFTPDQDPPKGIPHNIVNVVEDARIEKLMKRKYLGIAKSFKKGYTELQEQDFFELDGEDISNFNLADRANLYFKIGSFLDVSFSDAEKEIIDLIQNAETFTDTISASEALYRFCQQETQQKSEQFQAEAQSGVEQNLVDGQSAGDSSDSGDSDADSTDDIDSSLSSDDSDAPVEGGSSSHNNTPGNDDSGDSLEPQVRTADALQDKLKDLVTKGAAENVYLEVTDVNIENIIATNAEIHEHIDHTWRIQQKERDDSEITQEYNWRPRNLFEEVDSEYEQFKNDAKKEVSYLVKEFECKKSASAYARASTSRTGVLDTKKLHNYKFSEDIFKRVTVLPDGKNHGLIFVLDWSGSMARVMKDTIKQLYNLIWFCKKVQIPFEVYAFTNEWSRGEYYKYKKYYEETEYAFKIEENFNMMNIFTSKVNSRDLDHQLKNIWRTVASFYGRGFYQYPHRLCLSGTPLNEALICLHKILPQFQKENGVEKVQCIVLTDGEANSIPYHVMVERSWEDSPRMGYRGVNGHTCSLRDRKLGKTYKFGYSYWEYTDVLIRNLKDRFVDTNFIGIRVLEKRDGRYFIERYHTTNDKEYDRIIKDWRKYKAFSIKNSGYDAYFGMSADSLSEDAEFDVDESATKAQIKKAFVKSLKVKKLNKKVLGEFVSLVV